MRHAVIVPFKLDVVVDVDLGRFPAKELKAFGWEWLQRWGVKLLKGTAPATGQLFEGALIKVAQQQGDGVVELHKRKEFAIAQPGQDPALNDQNGALDLGLVSGVGRACCQQGTAIVGGEFFIQAVVLRVIAIRVLDQCAGLIWHLEPWHTTKEFQCQDLSADPVGGGLARGGAGERVVGGAKGGDEDLRFGDLAGGRINDGHGLTGVVNKQLLARNVRLTHGTFEAHCPFPVFEAKAGVFEGQLVVFGVFLPQQLQGDPGAFELSVHAGKVRGELFAVTR